MTYLIAYISTTLVFLVLDFIWLAYVARSFYREQLGPLMADPINVPVAVGFYAIYTIGIVIFAVAPALNSQNWQTAMIYGALFGFFAYATYDLTNIATIQDWPVKMSAVDMIWGTFLTATASTTGYYITRILTS